MVAQSLLPITVRDARQVQAPSVSNAVNQVLMPWLQERRAAVDNAGAQSAANYDNLVREADIYNKQNQDQEQYGENMVNRYLPEAQYTMKRMDMLEPEMEATRAKIAEMIRSNKASERLRGQELNRMLAKDKWERDNIDKLTPQGVGGLSPSEWLAFEKFAQDFDRKQAFARVINNPMFPLQQSELVEWYKGGGGQPPQQQTPFKMIP